MKNGMKRLSWACRRGMLELDVLLSRFLEEVYPHLSNQDQALFERYLSCSDPELYAFLLGQTVSDNEEFARMTEMIRTHARS